MGTEKVYKGLYGILGELWAFGGLVIKISCKWFSEGNTVDGYGWFDRERVKIGQQYED